MKVGLALGGGAARGWSHIGVINRLAHYGIEPDIVCGTSIGSLVGAAYVSDNLGKLQDWVESLSKLHTARFFEINRGFNGFVNTDRLHQFLADFVANDDALIEQFEKRYASVATELDSGREIWMIRGSVLEAVWASIALPGLFPAIKHQDRWLVDGGLVNPVPVSVCRALGADIVIAVNLNGDLLNKYRREPDPEPSPPADPDAGVVEKLSDLVAEYTASVFTPDKDKNEPPSLFDSIAGSINITQDRITRSRMAGDPPDILLSPKLGHIGLLEFYRAEETITEGAECVNRIWPEIRHIMGIS